MADDRYQRVQWRGYTFDKWTVAALKQVEHNLGITLTIAQGSYNTTVTASAGTHDGGGAVDVLPGDNPAKIVHAMRAIGFAAWHRLPSQGPWGEHIHAILVGNEKAAPVALRQVDAYRHGLDGLATNQRDVTWRPDPIPTFQYPPVSPEEAMLADLIALRIKHKVSLVKLGRVAFRGALNNASERPVRKAKLRAALVAAPKD